MDYSAEFLSSSVGREFVAEGFGGTTGFISSYPFDTLQIMQQQSKKGSAFNILKNVVAKEGPTALYRGMAVPFTSVAFQFDAWKIDLFVDEAGIKEEEDMGGGIRGVGEKY